METIIKQPVYRKKHKKAKTLPKKISIAEKTARRLTNEIKRNLKMNGKHPHPYSVNKHALLKVESAEAELLMTLSEKNHLYQVTCEKHPKDIFDVLLFVLTALE